MPTYGKRMSRTRSLTVGLISALVLSTAWIGCAPATASPPSPAPTGIPAIPDGIFPTAAVGSTEAPDEDVESRRLLIRQSLLKGYAARP